MAGKTFHGVGFDGETPPLDPEDAAPAADDGREPYSGPTVVDDAKIAESLKRLRSLDQPPGPLTGITVSVVDAASSEPTRIDDRPFVSPPSPVAQAPVASPLGRPTAVGHSIGPSVVGQQKVAQFDPLRGTMFGHSIHLPDVNTPENAPEDISSGAMLVVPRPTAAEMQPFLTDRTTRPAQQHPQVANIVQPLRRTDLFHEPEPSTEVVSGLRQRVRARTALVVVAVAAAAGVAFAWIYSHDNAGNGSLEGTPVAVPAPAPTSAPAAVAPPVPTPPPVEAVSPPPPAPTTAPAEADVQREPAPHPAARVGEDEAPSPRPHTAHRDRHAGAATEGATAAPPVEAKVAEPKLPELMKAVELAEPKAAEVKAAEPKAAEPKATKTGKTKKRAEVEEDPDATLPPSE